MSASDTSVRYFAMGDGFAQVVIEAGPTEQGQHGAFGSRPEQFPDMHEPAEICDATRPVRGLSLAEDRYPGGAGPRHVARTQRNDVKLVALAVLAAGDCGGAGPADRDPGMRLE
jgi:hypothetical protein